jgi:aldose 1-epimerase
VVWEATHPDEQTLVLTYNSPHLEEGYPGNLDIKVQYHLTDENELKIEYWATTDRPTPVNLTHHSFFNLKGDGNGTINDHLLQINADFYTPVDEGLIPTGEIAPVEDTPMDFRAPTAIGERVDEDFEQLKYGLGYDHNWVLVPAKTGLNFAARVVEPASGRTWKFTPTNLACSFTAAISLMAATPGKKAKFMTTVPHSVSKPSTFQTVPTSRIFRQPFLNPAKNITRFACINLEWKSDSFILRN